MKTSKIIIYSNNLEFNSNAFELITRFYSPTLVKTFEGEADRFKIIDSSPNIFIIYVDAEDTKTLDFIALLKSDRITDCLPVLYVYEEHKNLTQINGHIVVGRDEIIKYPLSEFELSLRINSMLSANLAAENHKKLITNRISHSDNTLKSTEHPSNSLSFFNFPYLDFEQVEGNLWKMAAVINHIPTAVIITSLDGTIEYVNQYFCFLTGFDSDEIVGEDAVILLSSNNPSFLVDELIQTIRAGETWKGELMNVKKNGSFFWSEVVIAPILDSNKRIQNFVSTLTDFTEKINSQTELEEICTQLQINEIKSNKLNQELIEQKQEIQHQRDELEDQKIQLEKQNEKLIKQQKSITASLEYALRIQQAMMAQQSELKDLFAESFIFYLPRDFISGDFYWYRKLDEHRSIIAAVDCTGHGIPGAFMSMLGSSLLSQIIEHDAVYEPEEILNQLDKGIVRALNQNITNNCDGMEVALVLVDRQKMELKFAGAGLPLAYVENNELIFIRGSKRPIGGLQVPNLHKQSYTTHTIPIQEGTTCYLFSDGFADQFDKAGKRKFLVKNFRDLLSSIKNEEMEEQFGLLFDALLSWKGKQKQTDDILVLGFRI